MDSRLTKLTQATTKLGNHAVQQSGKFDALIAKLDGMTQVIGEKMTTMQSQTETRLEVHADKLVKQETQLEYIEKQISALERQVAENDAYDKERSRMIEEMERQVTGLSAKDERIEEKTGKLENSISTIKAYIVGAGAVITIVFGLIEVFRGYI